MAVIPTKNGTDSYYAQIKSHERIEFILSDGGARGPSGSQVAEALDGAVWVVPTPIIIAGWDGAQAVPPPPVSIDDPYREHPTPPEFRWQERQAEDISSKAPIPPRVIQEDVDGGKWLGYSVFYDPVFQDDEPGLLAAPPSAFDDFDWQHSLDLRNIYDSTFQDDEPGLLAAPPASFDDEAFYNQNWTQVALPNENEPPGLVPIIPLPVVNMAWDDFDWNHGMEPGNLSTMFMLDDLTSAPFPSPPAKALFEEKIHLESPANSDLGISPFPRMEGGF